jgi:hypothetical protein
VRVSQVDYNSLDSLVAALRGQDAVVSTLPPSPFTTQEVLVEAASRAGVKRFIPSEFGSNTVVPKTAALPAYAEKTAVQRALREKAAAAGDGGGMTYTLVLNGPFLDWGIKVGFVLGLEDRHVKLYDGGERVFSTTTLATVGKAVAAVLSKPDETRNRPVYVQDTAITLKKLYEMGKGATPGEVWTEEVVDTDKLVTEAWEVLKFDKDPSQTDYVMKFIAAAIWGDGYGAHFDKTDNELLGIKELTDDEVQAIVNRYA